MSSIPLIKPFSFVPVSGSTALLSGFGTGRHGRARSLGLLLTLLLHATGLWYVVAHDPVVLKPPSAGNDGSITYIAPLAEAPPTPPVIPSEPDTPLPKVAPAPKPRPDPKPRVPQEKAAPRAPRPPVLAQQERPPRPTPQPPSVAIEPLTPAPRVAPQPDLPTAEPAAPSDDFSVGIAAARKRREDARAQDPASSESPAESESQRANRIARENLAFQQRGQGAERDQTGGVFQLRSVRLHNAEFMFRGWNTNFQRNWAQVVNVEQGSEPDIEMAVVKRMIALIRTHKTGEFIWESHRLGRQISLNADPAYDTELRQFLLKEFFPKYVRTSGR